MLVPLRGRAWLALTAASCAACVEQTEVGAFGRDAAPPAVSLERFTNPIAASGLSTCAVTSTGGLACWGNNGDGELGVGDDKLPFSLEGPVTPKGYDTGAHAIFGGGSGYCALRETGEVECWGQTYYVSIAGIPAYGSAFAPEPQTFIGKETVEVVIGGEWLCSLTDAGKVKCWGVGASGQLGNGSTDDALEPHDIVDGGKRFVYLAAAIDGFHTCAATSDGSVMCWGKNDAGQLGAPGPDQLLPTRANIEGVKSIAAGDAHTCARRNDASVWCWGDGTYGQLAGAPSSSEPVAIAGIPPVAAIAAGGAQTCVLASDSAVWCWGAVTNVIEPPLEVLPASFGATGVACGSAHGCAINAAHLVRCWGSNMFGQTAGGEVAL